MLQPDEGKKTSVKSIETCLIGVFLSYGRGRSVVGKWDYGLRP